MLVPRLPTTSERWSLDGKKNCKAGKWVKQELMPLRCAEVRGVTVKISDYFAELHVAGRLADKGWDIYFPHRDKGFDFFISKVANGSPILRPVQVKGKYPSAEKIDKGEYGYVGKLTQTHPEMVLAIPYFSVSSLDMPVYIAFMPWATIREHARGYRCQPAAYREGNPKPRREYEKFFDAKGIERLESSTWSSESVSS